MQKITFLYVGRVKTEWIERGFEQFTQRLNRQMDFKAVQIAASKNMDPNKQRQEESASILERLESLDGEAWLLDVKGKAMTSEEFASAVGRARDAGTHMIFILGGAYGVNDDVKKAVRQTLQLSPMTFPHEICSIIFLEQLYRAGEILRDSGYHHGE